MATVARIAPLPVIDLEAGMSVTFEAIDPATGGVVGNVTASRVVIYGVGNVDRPDATPSQPVFLLPAESPVSGDQPFLGNLPRG
jgi:hypothetical protein